MGSLCPVPKTLVQFGSLRKGTKLGKSHPLPSFCPLPHGLVCLLLTLQEMRCGLFLHCTLKSHPLLSFSWRESSTDTIKIHYQIVTHKVELPYDSAIPLLGIYPKELEAGTQICIFASDICMPVFVAALFTKTKR